MRSKASAKARRLVKQYSDAVAAWESTKWAGSQKDTQDAEIAMTKSGEKLLAYIASIEPPVAPRRPKFEVGDVVRADGCDQTAIIECFLQNTDGGVFLSHEIDGTRYWNVDSLVVVKKEAKR